MDAKPALEQKKQKSAPQQAPNHTESSPGLGTFSFSPDRLRRARQAPQHIQPGDVMLLQHTIGNHATADLLGRQTAPDAHAAPVVQAKLTVGPAQDAYEAEADRMAAQVMRTPSPPPVRRKEEESEPGAPYAPPSIAPIQRKTPVGRAGGSVDTDLESSLRRSQSGGSALPGRVRRSLEPTLGADLSGIKVHTGSQAAQLSRDLGAKAFTHKNHIYYGQGQSPGDLRLTAHEAVHTIQQGAVPQSAQRQMQDGAADRPRLSVQRTPAPTVQRWSLNPMKWTKAGREKAEAEEKLKLAQQEKSKADAGELLTLATEFERNLGKYLFNNTRAQQAASGMVNKMITALVPEMDETKKEHQQEIAKSFGSSETKYAGNVGTEFADVWAALKQGNLREKMTGLYNAMFGTFKQLMGQLLKNESWEEAKTRGLDVRKLKIRKGQLKWNPMAKDVYRRPRAFMDRKKMGTFDYSQLGSETRFEKEGSKVTKRTVGELEQGPYKVGLSERERKFMFPNKKEGESVTGETLPWEEGGTSWTANKNNKWVKTLTETLSMPVVAGPSGTAQRMYQLYEWLGKPVNIQDLRLALLGWMLVENDHSFDEIAQMGVEYGLPYTPGQAAYRHLEPLTEAEIRKNVNRDPKYPGLFPDEIQYHRKLDTGEFALMKPYMHTLEQKTTHAPLIEEQFGMRKRAYEQSGLKHVLRPVTAYTTIAYQTINMVAGGNATFTKMRLNSMLEKARTEHKEILDAYRILFVEKNTETKLGKELYDKYHKLAVDDYDKLSFAEKNMIAVIAYRPDITPEEIIAEAKVHREHVKSGLEVLPTFKGKVYRGEAQNVGGESYKKGTQINIKKFLSASRNSKSAVNYAKRSAGIAIPPKEEKDKPETAPKLKNKWYAFLRKPFVLEIESKTARDVNAVTVNENEDVRQKRGTASLDEVVFLPGTVLEVQNDPQPDPTFDNIPKVVLTEVKSGGVSDPSQRIEYNQAEPLATSLVEEEEVDDTKAGGITYQASDEVTAGRVQGEFDLPIAKGDKFQVLDPDWATKYTDEATDWVEIRYRGQVAFVLVYDLLRKATKLTDVKAPVKKD